MAILTRSEKIVWDDTSKEFPGDIYNNCLNNNFNVKEENSSTMSVNDTKRKFQGLFTSDETKTTIKYLC